MAQISQEQSLLSGLNNITAPNPAQTAQMQIQALSPIDRLGNELINKSIDIYCKDQQQKAINQAYTDASQGKFGTVAGITGANEAYNNIMNNIAPAKLVADAGTTLNNLYNTIKFDPNFNPHTATQQYAQGAKGLVDAYTHDNVPEQWKSQVSLTLQKQAMQYGIEMKNTSLERTLNMQTVQSIQAKDTLFKQITQASSLGNDGLAKELLTQYNNITTQGVASGQLTPLQGSAMQKQATDEITLQTALRTGQPIKDDPSLETKRLAINSQQQRAIEQAQVQSHFDFNNYLLNSVAGNQTKAPSQMTDEQYILANQAQTGNHYLTLAKNTDELGREQLFSQPSFMSLDPSIQRLVINQFHEHTAKLSSNPDIALGLEGKSLVEIGNALVLNKIPLSDISKTQRFTEFQNVYQTDQIGAIKAMKSEAGQYAQSFLSKMGVKDSASLSIDKVTDDPIYMAGIVSTNSARSFKPSEYSENIIEAMNNLSPEAQKSITQYANTYSKINKSIPLEDVVKTRFSTVKLGGNRTFVYNEDAPILEDVNNRKAISQFISKKYNIDSKSLFDHSIQLNIQGNAYNILDTNKRIIGSIPRDSLRLLPSPSYFERKKHAITDFFGDN